MAEELRFETLFYTVADGTTSSDNEAEFRNDSSENIHIREITYNHSMGTAGPDEQATIEISKAPVLVAGLNNGTWFTWPQRVSASGQPSAGATDGEYTDNGGRKWGKGQLMLEPGESLYVNTDKTSGGVIAGSYVIGYHW